eukprot:55374_1
MALAASERVYAQANLQLGIHQLYTDQEPNLEQFERLRDRVHGARDDEEVNRIFFDAIEKALSAIANITPRLAASQLNTNDYPHDFVHIAYNALHGLASNEAQVRALLRKNEEAVSALVSTINGLNSEVKAGLGSGEPDVPEPKLKLKDDQTGKWKAQWWKWSRRSELDTA